MADASRGMRSGSIDCSPRIGHAVAAAVALGAIGSLAPAVWAGERSDARVDTDDARTQAILGILDRAAARRDVGRRSAAQATAALRPGRATSSDRQRPQA